MTRRLLSVIMAAFLLFSCSGKNKIPNDVLPKPKMEALLWDMLCADQFVENFVLKNDSTLNKKTESFEAYEKIFKMHETNEDEFLKSLTFYRAHPDLFLAILDTIDAKHSSLSSRPTQLKLGDSSKSGIKTIQ